MEPHVRDRHVGAADLAGGPAEPDPGHIPDRRLLNPAGIRDVQPDVDRRAAVRAGRVLALTRQAAVRAGVGTLGRWHRHVRPLTRSRGARTWTGCRPGPGRS